MRHDEGWWKFKAQSCQPGDCCIPLGSFVFCDLFCSVFIHWLVRFRHKKDFVRCKTKWLCYNMPLHNSSPAHKQGTWHSMWHRVVLNKHWYVRNTLLIIAMIGASHCQSQVSLRHWQLWQIWLWQRSTPWEWEQAEVEVGAIRNPVLPRNFSNPHGTIDVIMKRVESSLKMCNPSNFIQIQSAVSTVSWTTDKQMTD